MTISNVGSVPMTPVYSGGSDAQIVAESAPAPVSQPAPQPAAQPAAPLPGKGSVPAVDDAELEKIMEEPVKQANLTLRPYDRRIEREIHEVTKAMMYTIRDTKTNEVIAEYPPKKIQDMIAKMWELAGLFIDQKA